MEERTALVWGAVSRGAGDKWHRLDPEASVSPPVRGGLGGLRAREGAAHRPANPGHPFPLPHGSGQPPGRAGWGATLPSTPALGLDPVPSQSPVGPPPAPRVWGGAHRPSGPAPVRRHTCRHTHSPAAHTPGHASGPQGGLRRPHAERTDGHEAHAHGSQRNHLPARRQPRHPGHTLPACRGHS